MSAVGLLAVCLAVLLAIVAAVVAAARHRRDRGRHRLDRPRSWRYEVRPPHGWWQR